MFVVTQKFVAQCAISARNDAKRAPRHLSRSKPAPFDDKLSSRMSDIAFQRRKAIGLLLASFAPATPASAARNDAIMKSLKVRCASLCSIPEDHRPTLSRLSSAARPTSIHLPGAAAASSLPPELGEERGGGRYIDLGPE